MPAGLEALPPPPALPGPLPLAGQVLAVAFATVVTASNASPIVVTTAAPHYLVSGVPVTISGVVGNTAANTTAVATVLTPTTFSIPVAGNGAYASGGTVTVNVLAQSVVIADPTMPANQAGVTAGGALKTDASATTQPVSGSVSVSNLPGTQPVSGSVAVSNLPATQPVSGTVSVGNFPATQPVSGTFWQATQPVSGTVTANAGSGTLAVSGTFWQATQPTSLAVAPALVAGEAHVGALGGATVAVSGSVTRPANTTSYSAGQVVGTAITDVIAIAGAARKTGGSGVILDALVIDQGGAAASAALELYLFTAPPTVQADQVAFALVAADLAALVAVVPVASSYVTNVAATIAGSRAYPIPGVNAGFVCAGGSTTLYGILVQRAAYTPISAEAFSVTLVIGQD